MKNKGERWWFSEEEEVVVHSFEFSLVSFYCPKVRAVVNLFQWFITALTEDKGRVACLGFRV